MQNQIFYVDPSDTKDEIIQRIKRSKARKVILVLPEENLALKNEKVLSELQNITYSLNKVLFVFSADKVYQKLCNKVGIPLEEYLVDKPFIHDTKPQRKVVSDIVKSGQIARVIKRNITAGEAEEVKVSKTKQVEPEETKREEKMENKESAKKEAGQKVKAEGSKIYYKSEPSRPKGTRGKVLADLAFWALFLILIASAAGIFFYYPSMELSVCAKSDALVENITLTGNTSAIAVDVTKNIVPAQIVDRTSTVTETFNATGNGTLNQKATGQATIYNNQSSAQSLVANTRFADSDGKIFRISKAVTVPANGTLVVTLTADQAGASYNIGPSTFTIPGLSAAKQKLVYAKSTVSFTGGFSGKTQYVTASDITQATAAINTKIAAEKTNLISQLKSGLDASIASIADSAEFEVSAITFSNKALEAATTFTGTATVTAKTVVPKEGVLLDFILAQLNQKVLNGKTLEKSDLDISQIVYAASINDPKKGRVILEVTGPVVVSLNLDTQALKEEIKGMKRSQVAEFIKNKYDIDLQSAQINFKTPSWYPWAPFFTSRIFVSLNCMSETGYGYDNNRYGYSYGYEY